MELKSHFQQTLLLMLLMAAAPYAWHSSRKCPEQGLPTDSACSRFEKYCPPGTVCEEWDHNYACKIQVGVSGCGTDNAKCVTHATCDSNTCLISAGEIGCGTDGDKCVTNASCISNICQIQVGVSGCGTDDDKCVTNAICVSDICLCGGRFSGSNGSLSSPNYPSYYPGNTHCVWTITAPEGHVVQLTFSAFDVEQVGDGPDDLNYAECPFDYLKLLDGIDADAPQFLMICGQGNPDPVTSPGNVLQIVFKTDDADHFEGFQIEYRFVSEDP